MRRSKSIQFDSVESVLKAYENKAVANWAIFCDKQFIERYQEGNIQEGLGFLKSYLELLSRSAAIYTLCVYDEVPDTGIKENTLCDGSFNFQLRERPLSALPADVHRLYQGNALELWEDYKELQHEKELLILENATLKKTNEQLQENINELEEEEPVSGIGQFLNEPEVRQAIPELLGALVSWIRSPGAGVNGQGVAMGAAPGSDVVELLRAKVTDLYDLLEKLYRLSEVKPERFNFYISSLRSMKV